MEDNPKAVIPQDSEAPEGHKAIGYEALTADTPLVEPVPFDPRKVSKREQRSRNRAIARGALIAHGGAVPDAAPPAPTPDEEGLAEAVKAEQDAAKELRASLHGSSTLPAMIEVGFDDNRNAAKVVQLGYVVAEAHKSSGMTVDEWNTLSDEDREGKLAALVEELKAHNGERAAPERDAVAAPEPSVSVASAHVIDTDVDTQPNDDEGEPI